MSSTRNRGKIQFVEPADWMFIPEIYTGSLKGLLPFSQKHPATMESAHMRGWRLIARQGIDPVETEKARRMWGDQNLFSYRAFSDFYGLETVIHRFVCALAAGADAAEASYSIFFWVGPPSSGKSKTANRIKDLFCQGEPALKLKCSDMRAHPLSALRMIPMLASDLARREHTTHTADLRLKFLQALDLDQPGALNFGRHDVKMAFARVGVEKPTFADLGKLTDPDQFISAIVYGLGFSRGVRSIVTFPDFRPIDYLTGASDPVAALAGLEIDSFQFLGEREGSVGVSSLKESEPLKFDLSELIGEENLNRFALDDPLPYQMVILNGLINNGHRGVAEFIEAAKNSVRVLRCMLELASDKSGRAPSPLGNRALGIDMIVVAHTNDEEFKKLVSDPGNAPYQDRFLRFNTPHVVQYPQIGQVLGSMWQRSEMANPESPSHVALEPCIEEFMARYLSNSRMIADSDVKDPMVQIDILGGSYHRLKETGTMHGIAELLRRAGTRQGMDGETNRFAAKIIDECAANARLNSRGYVTSEDVHNALLLALRRRREDLGEDIATDESAPPKTLLGKYEAFVKGPLAKWRSKRLARDVRLAMVANDDGSDLRDAFASRYIEAVENWLADPDGESVSEEDKNFVREVEAELGVTTAQADRYRDELRQFRNAVLGARDAHEQKHGVGSPLPHTFYPPLRHALDRMIMKRISPSVAIGILRSEETGTEKQREQLRGTHQRMVAHLGYTLEGARAVTREVERKKYLDLIKDDED